MAIPIHSNATSLTQMMPTISEPNQIEQQLPQVDFQKLLLGSLAQANQLEHQAERNVEGRLLGESVTSSEVYSSLKKSEMALKMMLQVRNKLVDAFQEIQQMRI